MKRIVCSTLKIGEDRYSEDLTAGDLAEWDSVAHVKLVMAVEQEFGVSFDIMDAIDVECVEDLLALVSRYTANAAG
jgi:acyl carrier protein